MSVRTKLIFALLLLAVVPLTLVSIYSYRSSIAAFRAVVESESGALADDIGSRMESVRSDLGRRIERLGSFPFRSMMSAERQHAPAGTGTSLSERLVAEIGDAASMLEALEFKPVGPPPPVPPKPGNARTPGMPPFPPPPVPPEELIIRMASPEPGAQERASVVNDGKRMVIQLKIPPVKVPTAEELAAVTSAAAAPEQALKKVLESTASLSRNAGNLNDAAKTLEQRMRDIEMRHARRYSYPVQTDGRMIGTVQAQVSSGRVLHSVLSRTRRRQGEIPFALDAQNALIAANPADQTKLASLPLANIAQGKADPKALSDWIVVTRKDQNSGMTFGIARPVGDSLQEIRRTAVRNLGLGLGVVALALIGILPLSGRMTRDLKTLNAGVEGLARGDLTTRVPVRSADEFGKLAAAFNRMAADLAEHEKSLVQQERLRKELEMCRRIQEELLPRQPLVTGFAEAKGISIPAREVGGDFFNYFPLHDGNVGLLMGDVSGKGLPAALLMANLQATIQARLPLEPDLAKLADRLDHEIAENTPAELYLTLFMATLNVQDGTLHYVNAGHNTQFALHSDGATDRLDSTGRPLGLMPGGGYEEQSVHLKKGDALFLYTDGLVETENAQGEEFGLPRLESLLFTRRLETVEEMLGHVDAAVRSHRGATEATDDATMLVLKVGA
jgi:serine phosphatase RsbU (regulator of sigma subunit)